MLSLHETSCSHFPKMHVAGHFTETGSILINASHQTHLIAALVTRSNDFGMLMMAQMSHELLLSCAVACADIPECFMVRQQDP